MRVSDGGTKSVKHKAIEYADRVASWRDSARKCIWLFWFGVSLVNARQSLEGIGEESSIIPTREKDSGSGTENHTLTIHAEVHMPWSWKV